MCVRAPARECVFVYRLARYLFIHNMPVVRSIFFVSLSLCCLSRAFLFLFLLFFIQTKTKPEEPCGPRLDFLFYSLSFFLLNIFSVFLVVVPLLLLLICE